MTKQFEFWAIGVLAVIFLILGYTYLQERDARIRAEVVMKDAQARITTLQQEKADIQKATAAKVSAIQKRAAEVKTPAQAIAAIPDVVTLPINARPLPDAPSSVVVEAVPLFQELSKCRATEAQLGGCEQLRAKDAEVIAEKDKQIEALKKRGTFWQRAKRTVIILGIGAGIGYAAHR